LVRDLIGSAGGDVGGDADRYSRCSRTRAIGRAREDAQLAYGAGADARPTAAARHIGQTAGIGLPKRHSRQQQREY
jgi:hypothetical protein